MANIHVIGEGTLFRNPVPHVYSRQAYFPSVLRLDNGELLASFCIGQAFEAEDLHSCIARSADNGETWTYEGRLYPGTPDRVTSDVCRLSRGEGGEVVAFVARHDRSRTGNGLANPDNMGFVETELLLFRSRDGGRTWTGPATIEPALTGPSFEMTSSIVPLRDGSWLLPTSTWRGWDGYEPNGMKAVALQTFDQGATWPSYLDVMVDPQHRLIYWESKIIELQDGRLLAGAWVYNEPEARDLPNHYAVTGFADRQFSPPRSTGLLGQTLNMAQLDDGRILTVYRRMDESGLWANVSRLDGNEWINEQRAPLWGSRLSGLTKTDSDMTNNFAELKFGAPTICRLADGCWFIAFWAVESGVSSIRWLKLAIE